MKFLKIDAVLAIHEMMVREHGGSPGVRDVELLESALSRPENIYSYNPKAGVFELAAAYCYGIVKNHPFIDGNKRTGATTMGVFLMKNGRELMASEEDLVIAITNVADGSLSEAELTQWIKDNSK